MKNFLRIVTLLIMGALILRFVVFSRTVDETVRSATVVSQVDFNDQRASWVGQQIRMQGVVKSSSYIPGIGYYQLVDSHGQSVGVLCNHYPPPDNQVIDVILYIQPVFKLNQPVTIHFEVEIVEIILSHEISL